MVTESDHDAAAPRGFWADYPAWLATRRRPLLLLCALLIALFLIGLWMSATPQDPFSYGLY